MLKIETPRLLIRDHEIKDLQDYHQWISDPEVMRYVNGFPQTKSIQESFVSLAKAIEGSFENPRRKYFIAITLKAKSVYIGSGGGMMTEISENSGILDIGYFLLKRYWGCGYATEATKAWIDYSFRHLNVHRIVADCDRQNESSQNIMKKCGMVRESEIRQNRYHHGKWKDSLQYAILRDDWESIQEEYCI